MVDASKSFEVSDNGIVIGDLWVGGGAATPTHSAAIGSRYFKTDGSVYLQAGPGTTDWILVAPVSGNTLIASPDFSWSRKGNVPSSTYLLNNDVPSNISGHIVPAASSIKLVTIACELVTTFDLKIKKRTGPSTFSDLVTVSVVSARTGTYAVNIALALGDELAAQLYSGSAKNLEVGIVIRGVVA